MDILTGKAKENFEEWTKKVHDDCGNGETGKRLFYIENIDRYRLINTEHYINNIGQNMLNALIIQWLDSVGIYIEILKEYESFGFNIHKGTYKKPIESISGFNNRQEVTIEAIKMANKIYNQHLNK